MLFSKQENLMSFVVMPFLASADLLELSLVSDHVLIFILIFSKESASFLDGP